MSGPWVAQELAGLGRVASSYQPFSQQGVEEHDSLISSCRQEPGQRVEPRQELVPRQGGGRDVEVGDGVVELRQGHWLQGGQAGREEGGDATEARAAGKPEVHEIIQCVHLCLGSYKMYFHT